MIIRFSCRVLTSPNKSRRRLNDDDARTQWAVVAVHSADTLGALPRSVQPWRCRSRRLIFYPRRRRLRRRPIAAADAHGAEPAAERVRYIPCCIFFELDGPLNLLTTCETSIRRHEEVLLCPRGDHCHSGLPVPLIAEWPASTGRRAESARPAPPPPGFHVRGPMRWRRPLTVEHHD